MKQEQWLAVEITVSHEASEAVEFALNELESLGNEINHLRKDSTEDVTVIGYFNDLPNDETLRQKFTEALEIYGFSFDNIKNIETKEIEDQDWLAEWKKHWKPTVTEKFIISPPWENVEDTEKIVVKIEPNMAFGTGTHETTRLCLRAIEQHYENGMSFFDVGTGTGILAIAVSKSATEDMELKENLSKIEANPSKTSVNSVAKILGCDTDVDSIKIARENAVLNDAEDIEFYIGSITEDSDEFDFVCANVTADVIIPLLPLLLEKSKKILVLSGILVEQKESVVQELEKFGFNNPKVETDGEWISILQKM